MASKKAPKTALKHADRAPETRTVIYRGSRHGMPYAGMGIFYRDVAREVPADKVIEFLGADDFEVVGSQDTEVKSESEGED